MQKLKSLRSPEPALPVAEVTETGDLQEEVTGASEKQCQPWGTAGTLWLLNYKPQSLEVEQPWAWGLQQGQSDILGARLANVCVCPQHTQEASVLEEERTQ
jgi:hypothetical protein